MAEDIRALSAEFARDPTSLVFLRLGEVLRQRRQLDAAERVALTGLERHPHLADAHDLLARIYSDRYDFERAFDEWDMVLRMAPEHPGAHKGLGFLYFRVGDMANALAHLEAASELEHGNASIDQALVTVRNFAQEQGSDGQRSVAPASELPAELPTEEVERGLDGLGEDMVLLDTQGRVLGGHVTGQQGDDVTEAAAAFLAGVSDEAARTSRLLEFGAWLGLSAEAGTGHLHLAKPRDGVLLLVIRDKGVPLGRMAYVAERPAGIARQWLDRQQ